MSTRPNFLTTFAIALTAGLGPAALGSAERIIATEGWVPSRAMFRPHYNTAHARRNGTHGSSRSRAYNRARVAR